MEATIYVSLAHGRYVVLVGGAIVVDSRKEICVKLLLVDSVLVKHRLHLQFGEKVCIDAVVGGSIHDKALD